MISFSLTWAYGLKNNFSYIQNFSQDSYWLCRNASFLSSHDLFTARHSTSKTTYPSLRRTCPNMPRANSLACLSVVCELWMIVDFPSPPSLACQSGIALPVSRVAAPLFDCRFVDDARLSFWISEADETSLGMREKCLPTCKTVLSLSLHFFPTGTDRSQVVLGSAITKPRILVLRIGEPCTSWAGVDLDTTIIPSRLLLDKHTDKTHRT